MSDMAAKADRQTTPMEDALQHLQEVRARLTGMVTRVIEEHASIQAQPESPECRVVDPSPSRGQSDLVQTLHREAREVDEQCDRLASFIGRSEVAA